MSKRSILVLLASIWSLSIVRSSYQYGSGRRPLQAAEGKSIVLHCIEVERALKDLKYHEIEKVEWRKDGYVVADYINMPARKEKLVTDARYDFDIAQFTLRIDQLRSDDGGRYKCWPRMARRPQSTSIGGGGSTRYEAIELSVIGPPTRPGQPIELSKGSREILIKWDPSFSHPEAPIIRYIIKTFKIINATAIEVKEETSRGNGTSWLVTGLTPLQRYRFQIAAENSMGWGPPSELSFATMTKGEAPSFPPVITSIRNGSNGSSVIVRWDSPPFTSLHNSAMIDEYRLIMIPIESSARRHIHVLKAANQHNTFEVSHLTPYTKYNLSLQADNVYGAGPPAIRIIQTSEGVPASAPTILGVRTISNSAILVTFSPPFAIRGILTHFTLYYLPIGSSFVTRLHRRLRPPQDDDSFDQQPRSVRIELTPSRLLLKQYQYRLDNLESCKKYSLRITASTSRGESESSRPEPFQTDVVAPSQPIVLNASLVGANSIFIEWLPPARICVQVDFYLVNLFDEHLNRRQFNTSETQAILTDLEPQTRYAITLRAATRSQVITDRQRYYVGPESISVRIVLIVSSTTNSGGKVVTFRTSICPFGDYYVGAGAAAVAGSNRQLSPRHHYQQRALELADTSSSSNVFYCDEGLIVPGFDNIMSHNSSITSTTTRSLGGDPSMHPADTHSSTTDKGGGGTGGVSVVAVAVLGTFGLLILLVLLVMVLVHFWRRYFGGKDCLAYAAEALDGNRNVQNDVESGDDPECDSVLMEDFVEYVKTMHADSDSGFARLYERIEYQCATLDHFQKLTYDHSISSENKMKNRYVNILPYDHSRVRLRSLSGLRNSNSDYINANFIDGFRHRRAYIATQGPLPNTIADFWRMVWEHKCNVIVMITNIIERGRKKCEQYWPAEGEETYGSYAVNLLSEHVTAFYTVRTMSLRCVKKKGVNNEPNRIVFQYHCTCWADHGVPESASAVLKFIEKSTAANRDPTSPIIVHCSAGVGRSGTYIVIDSMLRQMQTTGRITICGFLKRIRHQRRALVQTEEQYVFCYDAIAEAIVAGNTEIETKDFHRIITDWHSEPDSNSSTIKKQYEHIMNTKPSGFSEARKPYNVGKNRENAPLPADLHRVVISAIPGEAGSDYINASFLPGYHSGDDFIISQYPTEETTNNFWQMIWDHTCRVMVLLQDPDNQDFKQFWPQSESATDAIDCGAFIVSLLAKTQLDEEWTRVEVLLRSLQEEYQLLCQIVILNDFDSTTRRDTNSIWRFIRAVQERHAYSDEQNGPLVAIDSCGGRRAATFCLLSALNCQVDHESSVDIYTLARCYHERRPGVFPEFTDYSQLYEYVDVLLTSLEEFSPTSYANGGSTMPKSHHYYSCSSSVSAAQRSRSLPSSLRVAKSSTSLSSAKMPSSNGISLQHTNNVVPKDTTL